MAFFIISLITLLNALASSKYVVSHILENDAREGNVEVQLRAGVIPQRPEQITGNDDDAILDKRSRSKKESDEKWRGKMQDIPKVVMSHTGTYGHKVKTKIVQDAKILFGNQPATFHRSKGYKPFRKTAHLKPHKSIGRNGKAEMKRHETLHKMPLLEEAPVKKERLRNTSIVLPTADHIPIFGHVNIKAGVSSSKPIPSDSVEPVDSVEPMGFMSVEENESLKNEINQREMPAENARKRSESLVNNYRSNTHGNEADDENKSESSNEIHPMGAFGSYKPKPHKLNHPYDGEDDEEYFVKSYVSNNNAEDQLSGSGEVA